MINADVDAELQPADLKDARSADPETHDDMKILRHLFEHRGIASALQHDAIVNATVVAEARPSLQAVASDHASTALKRLVNSREQCRQEPINVPTWTGRSGSAGAPSLRSASILSSLKSRLSDTPLEPAPRPSVGPDFTAMMTQLRAYLQQHQKRATTSQLVRQFGISIVGEQTEECLIFQAALKRVARFERSTGLWILKADAPSPTAKRTSPHVSPANRSAKRSRPT
jgi:DNA excision repair protein ERCC-6